MQRNLCHNADYDDDTCAQVSLYVIVTAPSGLKVIGEVQIHVEDSWILKKQVCHVCTAVCEHTYCSVLRYVWHFSRARIPTFRNNGHAFYVCASSRVHCYCSCFVREKATCLLTVFCSKPHTLGDFARMHACTHTYTDAQTVSDQEGRDSRCNLKQERLLKITRPAHPIQCCTDL